MEAVIWKLHVRVYRESRGVVCLHRSRGCRLVLAALVASSGAGHYLDSSML